MRRIILLFGWIFAVMIAPFVLAMESTQLPLYDGFNIPLPVPVSFSAKCRDVDKCSLKINSYSKLLAVGNLDIIESGSEKQIIIDNAKAWISPWLTALKGEIHLTDKTVNYGLLS